MMSVRQGLKSLILNAKGDDRVTLKELSQYYYLKQEIKRYEEKIIELENKATSTTQSITGMPHNSGVSDKVGNNATEISYYRSQIELDKLKCKNELKRLDGYIRDINDSLTRQIFELRFIDRLKWQEVADIIGSSEYSVKHICYRYIKHY